MALNRGDGTHSPVWIVTQVSSGAAGRSRGGGTGSDEGGGSGAGAGGGGGAARVGGVVDGPDLAEHPPSASKTIREENARRIINPHVNSLW